MKKFTLSLILLASCFMTFADNYEELTKDFTLAKAEIQSMSVMTFGPEGILFVGDQVIELFINYGRDFPTRIPNKRSQLVFCRIAIFVSNNRHPFS